MQRLALSSGNKSKSPIIVMAHGLGGTREMRLYEYAEKFAASGYARFFFDYGICDWQIGCNDLMFGIVDI